ncbi:unnamed protein product [Diatraea saccharalis]|uniref:Uncharacterized protein n=1 Tax=Diatraea saccharalis TaxID=40085 RepID=A0A9N9N269_9NEOP|nr:unnamed protein product [Diatraea saccharalis]
MPKRKFSGAMPRQSRSKSNLSEEEKKIRRREQKKLSIRRARAKMSEAALEERRKKDRERYRKKKEQGQIKTIKDYTPRQQRNTCLCAIHTNNNFMVRALYNAKAIAYISATELVKSLCCDTGLTLYCLERDCAECKEKTIQHNDFNDNDTITYERWITKTVTVVVKGQEKKCKKTVKEKVVTTKKKLLGILQSNLPTLMKHIAYVMHQSNAILTIKQRLRPGHGLLHIDFPENYNCKYGQEIQSAHFGGSKIQLSLHTSVYYYTQSEPSNNYTKNNSFCTVSENINHDPVLICVHLHALINRILELSPNLKTLHILSDGPSTQYRNKSMFHLIATYLSKEFGVNSIIWHYSERGHGKGAPDGVGGCIKRICDSCVATGQDVASLDNLMLCLDKRCKVTDLSRATTPNSIEVPGTPDAPTEPNSPALTDRMTPDNLIMQPILRPKKRKFWISSDTDTDDDAPIAKKTYIDMLTSDDENIF